MLAGIANMLECFSFDTDDRSIALAMEAPYLFLREKDHYIAGASLFQPKYINLYLHSIGFHLDHCSMHRQDIPDFLRSQTTALLPLHSPKDPLLPAKPLVFTGMNRGRFAFTNLKPALSREADSVSYTTPMLLARLAEQTKVYTLEVIPSEPADFIPYLAESLHNAVAFWNTFQKVAQQSVSRTEYDTLKQTYLNALMHDLVPMAAIGSDHQLYNELKLLDHLYSYVFLRFGPDQIHLKNKLPVRYVRNAINWLQEDIVDRLYAHGASDAFVNQCRESEEWRGS